ncbi:MAG: hypothetical protein K0Q72_2015 [Armatimonadetes bacterium]|nr:hypothetical protein [Armatimonadota bacterium]
MEKHEAFLKQARSDFAVFELLQSEDRTDVPECHPLHYLQMATEKLAKSAFIAAGDTTGDRYSHVAFSHVPDHLARLDVAVALGWTDFRSYQAFLRRARPLFRQIDELNPSVGTSAADGAPPEGANVEYPWRQRNQAGELVWSAPVDHDFGLLAALLRKPDGVALLTFVRTLLERFDAIFR